MKTLSLETGYLSVDGERQEVCAEWRGWLNQPVPPQECELSSEQFERALIGEWEFLTHCVWQEVCGWQAVQQDDWPVIRWRFYPEGLLWEERWDGKGAWFPYSVYRAERELLIVRDPRTEPAGQISRYKLARVNRVFLWLYDASSEDEEKRLSPAWLFQRRAGAARSALCREMESRGEE